MKPDLNRVADEIMKAITLNIRSLDLQTHIRIRETIKAHLESATYPLEHALMLIAHLGIEDRDCNHSGVFLTAKDIASNALGIERPRKDD